MPVIVDLLHDNQAVQDSWTIAKYLEEKYPNTPSLFNGNVGVHHFFTDYCTHNLLGHIFRLSVLTIHSKCGDQKDWFRQDREKFFKMSLEKFAGDEKPHIAALKKNLVLLAKTLQQFPFLTGAQPGWADVVLGSYLTMFSQLRPELFDAIVMNAPNNGGKAFAAWWQRMQPYMQDQPPVVHSRM